MDQIRNYPNVLILTTSNLTSSIDLAFIDRSDLKQFIGYPSIKAIYEIYLSAIKELKRVKSIFFLLLVFDFNSFAWFISGYKQWYVWYKQCM